MEIPHLAPELKELQAVLNKDADKFWDLWKSRFMIKSITARKEIASSSQEATHMCHDNIMALQELVTYKLASLYKTKDPDHRGIDTSDSRELMRCANLFKEMAEHVAERDEYLLAHMDFCDDPDCAMGTHYDSPVKNAVRQIQPCGQLAYSVVFHLTDCEKCRDDWNSSGLIEGGLDIVKLGTVDVDNPDSAETKAALAKLGELLAKAFEQKEDGDTDK